MNSFDSVNSHSKISPFQHEILRGLLNSPKSISPKFLYDEKGSEIFEEICTLPEYYPVHAETEILKNYSSEMAKWIGEDAILIEPGCGNCRKVQFLLSVLKNPNAYIALDISKDFLFKTATALQKSYPHIPIYPVVADYTEKFSLPVLEKETSKKRVIFFPGSTIGNLHPTDAKELLERMSALAKTKGGLLIGVDMKKDAETLELAYDDPKGVTAEFNFNLLDRLNREFSGSFNREHYSYRAQYNDQVGRVEMFLVSKSSHSVQFADETIHFQKDETLHTEDSYKYTPNEFIALAESTGFHFKTRWSDAKKQFSVYYFEKA